jgi:hypothetical protein
MLDGLDSTSFTTTSSFNAVSSSFSTRVANTEATASAYVASSGSFSTRTTNAENYIASINAKTGSYATTGSNYFIGTQVITGSVYIANDLIVQGSSSLQNITASAVSVGTNTIILNTATPILQFGGISVFDSGSTMGRSGSLLWNSINDHWINVNPSGSDEGYNSAMIINGPKNTGSLGNETGLTTGYIPRSQGEDHIENSNIYSSGSLVGINTNDPQSHFVVGGTANSASVEINLFNSGYGRIFVYNRFNSTSANLILNDPGGNVGIGVTNPVAKLAVSNGGADTLEFAPAVSAANNRILSYNRTTNTYSGLTLDGETLFFKTSDSERMRIANGGNVGIGTTNPTEKLYVQGKIFGIGKIFAQRESNGADTLLQFKNESGADRAYIKFGGTNEELAFYSGAGSSEHMRITSGGNVGIGETSPSSMLHFSRQTTWGTSDNRIININNTGTGGDINTAHNMGSITWYSGNSTPTAEIAAYRNTPASGNNIELRFYTAAAGTPAERMRITSGGNVGIGTTNPSTFRLWVSGNQLTDGNLQIDSGVLNSPKAINFNANSSTGGTYGDINWYNVQWDGFTRGSINVESDGALANGRMIFKTGASGANAVERMRIASDGKVTITLNQGSNNQFLNFVGTQSSFNQEYGFGIVNGTKDFRFYDYTVGTERMRITSGGNIQITNPNTNTQLVIINTSTASSTSKNTLIQFQGTDTEGAVKDSGAIQVVPGGVNYIDTSMLFYTRGGDSQNPRMTITGGGNVGIGSTAPTSRLTVIAASGAGALRVEGVTGQNAISLGGSGAFSIDYPGVAGGRFLVRDDGLVAFPRIQDFTTGNSPNTWINPASSFGIYINTSSIRYKRDIVDYDKGLDILNQIRPVYYKGTSEVDGDKQFAGFIAEEIDELGLTEFVNYLEDGRPNSLSYPNMLTIAVKAIKELSTKNDALEARLAALESAQ